MPVRRLASEAHIPFIVGTDQYERGTEGGHDRYYNAAVLVGPDGQTRDAYRKVRLVPFGEYVPFVDWIGGVVQALAKGRAGSTLLPAHLLARREAAFLVLPVPLLSKALSVARGLSAHLSPMPFVACVILKARRRVVQRRPSNVTLTLIRRPPIA